MSDKTWIEKSAEQGVSIKLHDYRVVEIMRSADDRIMLSFKKIHPWADHGPYPSELIVIDDETAERFGNYLVKIARGEAGV